MILWYLLLQNADALGRSTSHPPQSLRKFCLTVRALMPWGHQLWQQSKSSSLRFSLSINIFIVSKKKMTERMDREKTTANNHTVNAPNFRSYDHSCSKEISSIDQTLTKSSSKPFRSYESMSKKYKRFSYHPEMLGWFFIPTVLK